MKDIVESRVREELERRKDEIENEVKRRVDVLKRTMEKQMLLEIEKRNNEEMRRLIAKEVRRNFFNQSIHLCFSQEEERKKREDLERIVAENERKLAESEKRLVSHLIKEFHHMRKFVYSGGRRRKTSYGTITFNGRS